jgi:hypothetical protein
MPHEIAQTVFQHLFPDVGRQLERTMTVPISATIVSQKGEIPPGTKAVPYITFSTVVGRNSAFPLVTAEQLEELGGALIASVATPMANGLHYQGWNTEL